MQLFTYLKYFPAGQLMWKKSDAADICGAFFARWMPIKC